MRTSETLTERINRQLQERAAAMTEASKLQEQEAQHQAAEQQAEREALKQALRGMLLSNPQAEEGDTDEN